MARPLIVGILNITADSFSDGGRFLDPRAAIAHGRHLAAHGADIVELGAAASNIAADPVVPEEEIRRLEPVIAALAGDGISLSIDSFQPAVQRYALVRGVDYLNDILGFPDPALYPDLAAASCRLIVMHAIDARTRAQRVDIAAEKVWRHIDDFFARRIATLEAAGIARQRLVLDPGMGLFLSTRPEASFSVLAGIERLKASFGLPVMISVSRKSFLAVATGRRQPGEHGPATLAAELYAAAHGADLIRTHDPAALRDGLAVAAALSAAERDASARSP
jgi:dihydropteroate synthase